MFSAIVNSSTSPRRCRSSGMCPTPASSIRRALGRSTSRPAMTTRPLSRLRRPVIASISSLWPLPSTPAMPTISPARTESETPLHLREPAVVAHVEVVDLEQHVALRARRRLLDAQQHLAPDHHPREPGLRRAFARDRVDRLAAPQNRDPVGDLEHLVQLVADEDDRHALADERAQDLEELARLLRRQDGRRLVEDQDVRRAVERLQDLDPLLLADADVLHLRRGVDREVVRACRAAPRAARPPPGRGARPRASARWRGRCSRRPSSPGSA